jgi:uncharacterized membrane protein
MEFVTLLIVLYLFYLTGRVSDLEKKLKGKETFTPTLPSIPVASASREGGEHLTEIPPIPQAPTKSDEASIVDWLKRDFMVKLGGLLLLLAFGWFVSYAFTNNWIGPFGRIVLGILAGVAFILFGAVRMPRFVHQGALFAALGSTIVLLTTYAAREMYSFFTPGIALLIMFLSVAAVGILSARYRLESLTIVGIILGAIAPLLTNSPEPSVVSLFSYLAVLVLGAIGVMTRFETKSVLSVSNTVIFVYSLLFMFDSYNKDSHIALLFGFGFTVLFTLVNAVMVVHRKEAPIMPSQIYVAVLGGLSAVGWVLGIVAEPFQVLMLLAWSVFFAGISFLLYRRVMHVKGLTLYGVVSVLLAVVATCVHFDGAALTIALTLEATALVGSLAVLVREKVAVTKALFAYILPTALSFEHLFASAWNEGFLHIHFFALLNLAVCLLIAGGLVREMTEDAQDTDRSLSTLLLGVAGLYIVALVWLVSHAVMLGDLATTTSLFVYTVAGIIFYIKGIGSNTKELQMVGGLLIGGVVIRLLFIDVWQMPLAGRIVTFFVIGILLISTAFVKKLQHKEEQ